MKAFIFEPLWDMLVTPDTLQLLKDAGIEYEVVSAIAPLNSYAPLYEGSEERMLYVSPDSVDWKLTQEDIEAIPSLVAIFTPVTSFSWIELGQGTGRDIPISNIKGYSAKAVAEWAIMSMLNVARQTPRLIKDGFPLDYGNDFVKYRGVELHGKTVGIIGMGTIGKEIAKRCKGLGMEVVYWSKNSRADEYKFVELAELMSSADVVFPMLAVNDETKKIITNELLQSMKQEAIMIESIEESKELFDREVVLAMVKEGRLLGYAFESRPHEFSSYEGNVWAPPAYGWTTDTAMNDSVRLTVENMVAATKGEYPDRVN